MGKTRFWSVSLKIQEQDALLELEVAGSGAVNTPGHNDVRMNVSVRTAGYAAADHCWVLRPDLERFLRELRTLDQTRQGQAVLVSVSPVGLRLEFYSTDSAGHMAIRGQVGRTDANGFLSQLRFGFTFEPDKLSSVLEYFETGNGIARLNRGP
jgi:hypothetical protein